MTDFAEHPADAADGSSWLAAMRDEMAAEEAKLQAIIHDIEHKTHQIETLACAMSEDFDRAEAMGYSRLHIGELLRVRRSLGIAETRRRELAEALSTPPTKGDQT